MAPERHVVLAAIDGEPMSDVVLDAAIAGVRRLPGGQLHIVHVVEPPLVGAFPRLEVSNLVDEGRKVLARATARVAATFGGPIETHLVVDLAARGVLTAAADLRSELLVVGSHGKSCIERTILGSVSRTIVVRAHCPVLVVRPVDYGSDERRASL